jgi:hypothetical protein
LLDDVFALLLTDNTQLNKVNRMAIDKEVETKILRYHFVEKWRTGTIATQLGIHHSVVDYLLMQACLRLREHDVHQSSILIFPSLLKHSMNSLR